MRKFLITSLLLCGLHTIHAQNQRVFSQFFMNPYLYNPAYAGVEGHSAVYVLGRNQWTGIDGSPTIGNISFHTPLKGGLSVGVMANNDRNNFLTTSEMKGTLGYLATFDKNHYIRFGLSLGAGTTSLDVDNIDAALNDPSFFQSFPTTSFMTADFGISYHFDHFNIGVALPTLISRDVINDLTFSKIRVSPLDNMLIKVNYRGHITHDFAIEPHLLYRYSSINANQYEAAVVLHVKHIVWVGGSYRQDAGAVGLFGLKLKEKIAVGYSYDIGAAQNNLLGATHEINIGIHLSTKKKHHSHSHSFIKSHQLSAEKRAELAEIKRQKALDELLGNDTEEPKTIEELKEVAPIIEKVKETPEKKDELIEVDDSDTNTETVTEEGTNMNEPTSDIPTEESREEFTERTGVIEEAIAEETGNVTEEIEGPPTPISSKNPNTVKRGKHFLELPHGNHVIAGAFDEFQHAEDFSDKLFQRGFHDTIVGYVSAKGLYYTVIFRSSDYDTAEAQKEKFKLRKGLDKVWVLTVE